MVEIRKEKFYTEGSPQLKAARMQVPLILHLHATNALHFSCIKHGVEHVYEHMRAFVLCRSHIGP
jgi:hypothetical protein